MDPFIGQLIMFAGNFAPRGWAFCEGQLLPIATNTALFSILGTLYGGDGRTTFALPDLRGRVPIHNGAGPGLPSFSQGQKGGLGSTTLQPNNVPIHHHTLTTSDTAASQPSGAGGYFPSNPARGSESIYTSSEGTGEIMGVTTADTGSGQEFNNMQPFICINYIIALQGSFPSRS